MGNYFVKLYVNPYLSFFERTKRKIEEMSSDDDDDNFDAVIQSSKRRKFTSTSEYIYNTLFVEGRESDITVKALGHQWHLHKVYLRQSPYFRSMFSGNWKEANESTIEISILDDNITVDSIATALGSLYRDDFDVKVEQVIPLLATAILLQMDSMIEHCASIMKETINIQTVLVYRDAAWRYGSIDVEKSCKNWLLHNLLNEVVERPNTLRQISISLMLDLVSSPDLCVMQTEFSVYVMLKTWVFLKLNPAFEGSGKSVFVEASKYFKERKEKSYFLEDEGTVFAKVFAAVRLIHLILSYVDIEVIHGDRIYPPSWIQPAATQQWYYMLRINEENDMGPKNVSEDQFNAMCTRCGRVLLTNSQHIWRWTGYNFNLDLILTHENSVLKLKRNHRADSFHVRSSSQQTRKNVMFKVTVTSVNEQKQIAYTKSTGVKSALLSRNEEIRILSLDSDIKYPLYVSANFLVVNPMVFPLDNPDVDL